MQKKKPDPRVLSVWRLRLIPAAALLLYLSFRYLPVLSNLWWIFNGLWVSVLLFLSLVYFPLKYCRLSYMVNSRALVARGGVLSTRIKAVPFHAVQYASILTTPLMRQFGICSLIFYMAGSRIRLPGLTIADAETLRGKLVPKKPDGGTFHE